MEDLEKVVGAALGKFGSFDQDKKENKYLYSLFLIPNNVKIHQEIYFPLL